MIPHIIRIFIGEKQINNYLPQHYLEHYIFLVSDFVAKNILYPIEFL
jgi:ABC-type Fe3+-siderophore transport system permease subunit